MPTPPPLPPNPSLLAVALVTRTRIGPRFIFHYPSSPSCSTPTSAWHAYGSDSDTSSDSDSETATLISSDARSDKAGTRGTRTDAGTVRTVVTAASHRTLREGPEDESEDESEKLKPLESEKGTGRDRAGSVAGNQDGKEEEDEWEHVLGYPTDGLAKLLCPPRQAGKKRFEVMIDDVVFLGYPVFAKEDGAWMKKRRKKDKEEDSEDEDYSNANDKSNRHGPNGGELLGQNITLSPMTGPQKDGTIEQKLGDMSLDGSNDISKSYSSQGGVSEPGSEAKSASSNGDRDDLTMFNVIFIMNPPALEYHLRVQEMYENVAKKLAKALRIEQARSGYVWKEAKKITSLIAHAKETKMPMSILWPRIITTSPLAKSLATVYTNISASKIAHVDINASFDTSLQIPQANSTPYVPTPTEPQMPGLWLATSSMLEEDSAGAISPHSALLLLEDKETLLKDIEGDNKELAGPLSFFIRELTPTKSLQKLSTRFELLLPDMNLHLPDMQFLARHLIYWRRARAIAPLHIRNIYIVSPNCDLRQLKDATPAFAQRFQALPSLPKMLQLLSAKPIQYGYLIPSHDHKPAYMEILAWLLRGGWVTQLRTFAWVKVTPEIKATVAAQMKRQEKIAKAKKERAERKEKGSMGSDSAPSTMRRKSLPDEESAAESQPSRKSSIQIQSPRLSGLLSPPRPPSDAGSNSSGRTAVHVSQLHMPSPALKPSPLSAVDNLPNSPTDLEEDVASVIAPLDSSGFEQSLVLSPHKANTEESRWLEEVGKSLSDQELREVWPVLCKYFDGRWAFEEIAAREGWKRSRASNLLGRLEKEGVLCVVRHW